MTGGTKTRGQRGSAAGDGQRSPGTGAAGKRLGGDERLRFETLLADLSARFVNLAADRVDAEIEEAQRRVCECLGLDMSALWQWDADRPGVFVMTHLYRPLGGPPAPQRMEASEYHPWSLQQVMAGKTVAISSMEDVPPEAARDLKTWRHYGIKTTVNIPLNAGGGQSFGAVSFNDMRAERTWSEALVKRLELVAQVFANAILRRRHERALGESEERFSLATEAADAGAWVLEAEGVRFWVGAKIMDLLGLPPGDYLEVGRFLASVHDEDRARVREAIQRAMKSRELTVVEYRIVRPDGEVRWLLSRGRMCDFGAGSSGRLMGITADITGRKDTERQLRQALDEVKRLHDRLEKENIYLREQVRSESGHGIIVGESEPVLRMLAAARKVAPTDAAVLITGETGTGKELLAQAIHDFSARKGKTMVKVNCAALPASLIESELFGRERGAYTGALTQQIGRFEIADGSTVFLDEIGDLPLELQTKLLRVLQDGQFERLGSHRTLTADVRVIAATNRNLEAMVQDGTFREDLFHRLNVFPIEVPPLRARTSDIPLLAWKIVQEFNAKMGRSVDSIPKQTLEKLQRYAWPGNVRELRNLIERAMIVSDSRSLRVELPYPLAAAAQPPSTLEDVERRHILAVLERTRWRISGKGGAAEILGLLPTTLHARLKKLGLSRPKP